MSQIIVLGWDGLDTELISEFGLDGRFGMQQTTIATECNPVIGKPHTMELWPSMITGVGPDEHGVVAVDESDGVEWDNPLLNHAAPLARSVLPQSVVSELGRILRQNGADLDAKRPAYYEDVGVPTVFDDISGRAISIPNYQTAYDRQHKLDANRDELWAALDIDKSPTNAVRPQVDAARVYDILGTALGKRLGHTMQAMQSGAPLVWTWFGVLGSVGHMNPAVDESLQRDWYGVAASVTELVHSMAGPETTVIAVSDHGIQDGVHTEYATLCSDSPDACAAIDHVHDVADWIRASAPTGHSQAGEADETPEQVQSHLEELGYI
jgi:hypothetical protein